MNSGFTKDNIGIKIDASFSIVTSQYKAFEAEFVSLEKGKSTINRNV